MRADNRCVVLESKNFDWEKTRFVSKDYGQFEWPRTLDTPLPGSAGAPARRPLSECEALIVAHFEDPAFFSRLIAFSLVEKRDASGLRASYAGLFKVRQGLDGEVQYVLRNMARS
ncbi:MAG: hypothetical protein DI553_01065 [Cutibacterium acnes]|nr:MAG: hypothetical protein DI553_01065 [Cutibacterium acnes]